MDGFLNVLKAHASALDQTWAQPRLATVTSVHTDTATVRVLIQPENVLSGWLPVAGMWVGDGWGLSCPPCIGEQVVIIWQEGDGEHGIVIGRLWSSKAVPPAAASGEIWLMHKAGSFIKLMNDGSIQSSGAAWMHSGDLHVSGDIYDHHGALSVFREHYNAHAHPPDSAGAIPQD